MEFSKINFFCVCVVGLVLIVPVHNAPKSHRSKHRSSTKHDQTQSGDYNIQVRLKDFHIIAVLGDALGGLGDYDYNYDYSDLTIKPLLPSTTSSPENSTNTETEQSKPEIETDKPDEQLSSSTTLQTLIDSNSTTLKPELIINLVPSNNSSQKVSAVIFNPEKPINSTTQKPMQLTENPEKNMEKVEIPKKTTKLDNSSEIVDKKTESPVTNISIVPAGNTETVQKDQHLPLGEIMHYRKCAEGYGRDKQGRCRKNRWTPQLPFGLSRFASSLASKFRHATAAAPTS